MHVQRILMISIIFVLIVGVATEGETTTSTPNSEDTWNLQIDKTGS